MPAFTNLTDREVQALLVYMKDVEAKAGNAEPAVEVPETIGTRDYDLKAEVVAEDLRIPWAIAFPPGDAAWALITERPGRCPRR